MLFYRMHDYAAGVRLYNTDSDVTIKRRRKIARELAGNEYSTSLCEAALQQCNDNKEDAEKWLKSEESKNYLLSGDSQIENYSDIKKLANVTSESQMFCEKIYQIFKNVPDSVSFICERGKLYREGFEQDLKMNTVNYNSNWESIIILFSSIK